MNKSHLMLALRNVSTGSARSSTTWPSSTTSWRPDLSLSLSLPLSLSLYVSLSLYIYIYITSCITIYHSIISCNVISYPALPAGSVRNAGRSLLLLAPPGRSPRKHIETYYVYMCVYIHIYIYIYIYRPMQTSAWRSSAHPQQGASIV